jgi:NAD(P)-dependent dehydrogenase (short-subunit alcohol dehydrogenase family)
MLQRRWGRIVNISSGIPSHPEAMIGMNAYATSKAAVEAQTLNLAAELAGSGVTANVFRPGSVDTAMQAWIREQEPTRIGADLHRRFARSYAEGSLMSPEQSAQAAHTAPLLRRYRPDLGCRRRTRPCVPIVLGFRPVVNGRPARKHLDAFARHE